MIRVAFPQTFVFALGYPSLVRRWSAEQYSVLQFLEESAVLREGEMRFTLISDVRLLSKCISL